MSAFQTVIFRATYVLIIKDCRGRWADTSGTRCELIIGILDRLLVKAIVL